MITSFIVLTVCSYLFKKRGSTMLTWIRRRAYIIASIGIALLTVFLLGMLWRVIPQTVDIDLKYLFILAFGIGSMGLFLIMVSLYFQIRAFHLWTDINVVRLTKDNPVSPCNSKSYKP